MGKYYDAGTTYDEMRITGRKNIGSRIRFLRKSHGDKQKDIAELCEVTKSYISKVELGKSDIKASMIPLLADRYDVYAETFFSSDGMLPGNLISMILKTAGYEKYTDDLIPKMFMMANKAVDRGNGKVLADMLYVIMKLCSEEKYPLEYIGHEIQRVKEGAVGEEISDMAE